MMALGQPILDPLGANMGAGLGAGLLEYMDQQRRQRDWGLLLQALTGQQQAQPGFSVGPNTGSPAPSQQVLGGMDLRSLAALRDPQMQQMAMSLLGESLISPLERMKLGWEQQTDIANASPGTPYGQAWYAQQAGVGPQAFVPQPTPQQQQQAALEQERIGISRTQPGHQLGERMRATSAAMDALRAQGIPDDAPSMQALRQRWDELAKLSSASTTVNLGTASPTERQALAQTQQSLDALNNLKMLFDSAATRTGPVVGRTDPVAGLFGLTTGEQEGFMAATTAFKNHVIKEITGAQMSEAEAARIMKQVPDITDPPARWQAKWEQSKKNLEMLQARRQEILRKSGINAPDFEPTGKVRMQAPDGTVWEIDPAEMAEAARHGYTRVQ